MLKFKFLLVSLFVLFSCDSKNNNVDENRIIYELEDKHSKYIIQYFEAARKNSKGNKYNLKIQFVEISGYENSYTIHFNSCDEYYKNERYMELTNRFLRLSNDYLIPIVPSEDAEFSINSDKPNVLQNWVGSKGVSFIVQVDGSIQKMTMM